MAKSKCANRASVSTPGRAQERKWRAESALRTLTEAKKYESDKRLMADVKKLAAEEAKKLTQIAAKK